MSADPYAAFAKPDPYAGLGAVAPPESAPQPTAVDAVQSRKGFDRFKMGVRDVMTGTGGLVDIVGAPLNATVNALTGQRLSTHPGRDIAEAGADALNLPAPASNNERLVSAINEGGVQGLAMAGAAIPLKAGTSVASVVARNVAAHPIADAVVGATSGASSETARQHGVGPLGQLAAGLVGGLGGVGAVGGARRAAEAVAAITERFGPKAAKVVTEVPREAVIDEKGELTDEGLDVAAHNKLHPDELKAAYDHAEEAVAQARAAPVAEDPAAPPQDNAPPVEAAETPQPTGAMEPPPSAAPEAAVVAEPLPPTAQDRVAQAGSEGVDLTRGQATQDFGAQSAEEQLKATASPEGTAARQFFAKQQQQIAGAVDRFKEAFGDPEATAETRGQLVKGALTELRDQGKAGVSALYEQARKLAEAAGGDNPNLIHLDTAPILKRMREIFIDEGVDAGVRQALKQQAAKYGLIGDSPKTVEGETSVSLRDNEGQPAGKIAFTGPPQRLTILNAEDLRQFVNSQYPKDTTAALQSLKPLIDDAVQTAVERAASEGTGDVGKAFQEARSAHQQQVQTFRAKDTVQKLIDWKRGTQTPQVLPENAIKAIFAGGKEAVTELKKVKAVLLSKPTPNSKAAWQAIQAHAVADIFDKALVLNARMEGGELTTISGAKLNTAIQKFGADKLKVLLPEADFNQLMKLRRIVGDATIPIDRVTNTSGSGWAVIRFLAGQGVKLAATAANFIPGVREIGHMAGGLASIGKEAAAAKKTLAGIEGFDEAAAAKADAPPPEPADYAKRFVRVAGSDQTLATLLASAANEQRR